MCKGHNDKSSNPERPSRPWIDLLYLVPAVLIGIIALMAAMSWVFLFIGNTGSPYFTGTPFGIAGACAIFGGMGYAAGFSGRGTPFIRGGMLVIGTLYFVAALALTLTGMLAPTVQFGTDGSRPQDFMKGFMNYALAGSAVVAMMAFAFGTGAWGYIFPKLIRWHLDQS